WLTAVRQPDSAYGNYPTHFVCRFSGTPGQANLGAQTMQVTVQDLGGLVYNYTKSFFVQDVNDKPLFGPLQDTLSAWEDSVTRWTPKYKDVDPLDTHTLAIVNGPAFASVQGMDIVLRPGSRDVGQFTLRISVSDGNLLDTLATVLTVLNVNDPPYAFASTGFASP